MAKDTREIHRAIRMPGQRVPVEGKPGKDVFKPGAVVTDPDDLAALANSRKLNLRELSEAGIISGDWKPKK